MAIRPRAKVLASLAFFPAALLSLAACVDEDTGQCCTSVTQEGKDRIPVPDRPMGTVPRDIIRCHPKFECEALACSSYQGSEPFCTRECSDDKPCPEGFECQPIIQSEIPTSTCSPPGVRFCVRKSCTQAGDCPDDWTCELVYEGAGTEDDPVIRQCVKPEHKCSAP
jgi:hypothetical protein